MSEIQMRAFALLTGTPVPFRGEEQSAIAKTPVTGPLRIGFDGFEGNQVADTVNHGGADKAIHLYPLDHADFWRERMPGHASLEEPGAFGENIASLGATEDDMCIGDRFRFGSALVEISHGRQPCWKLDHRFGQKGVMATIVETARCGIYFRVIEEGFAQAGDVLTLTDRPLPNWSVSRVFHLLIGKGGKGDPAAVRELAGMDLLAQAWRGRAVKLAGT